MIQFPINYPIIEIHTTKHNFMHRITTRRRVEITSHQQHHATCRRKIKLKSYPAVANDRQLSIGQFSPLTVSKRWFEHRLASSKEATFHNPGAETIPNSFS